MASLYFRIPLDEVAYVRAILEGYDGVAVLIARNADRGEIEWLIGEGMENEADQIATRLIEETGMVPIPRPMDWK